MTAQSWQRDTLEHFPKPYTASELNDSQRCVVLAIGHALMNQGGLVEVGDFPRFIDVNSVDIIDVLQLAMAAIVAVDKVHNHLATPQ